MAMARAIGLASVLAVTMGVTVPAFGEQNLLDEYIVSSWSDDEGLSGGWIVDIVQDRHGYLWIGTVSGLTRFDGLRFERFSGTPEAPLPQRSVSAVHAARDGSVWVGFSGGGGVYRIRPEGIRDYGPSEGLASGRVTDLVEDADGTMLAATPDGLYRLAADRWERIDATQGLPDGLVHTVLADQDGTLWAATSNAVHRRGGPQGLFRAVVESIPSALSVSRSAGGAVWVTDPTDGYRPLEARPRLAGPGARPRRGSGYKLLHDRRGNLWVATLGQGLWFVRNGDETPQVVGVHNGLSSDSVRSLFEDRNGDVWVGTTVGLHRFARRRVTPIADLGVVAAVTTARDGEVWVGTTAGLFRFGRGGRRWYGTGEGLPSLDVRALHVDLSGALWVATATGLTVFANEQFSPRPLTSDRWPSSIRSLTTDPAGNVWICTLDHGLFRWRDGRLSPVDLSAIVDRSAIHLVERDTDGRVWLILAGGGLAFIDAEGAVQVIREGDKFHRSELAFYDDQRGAIWFGAGERLSRFQNGTLSAITTSHGLPAGAIRSLAGDTDGNLWIGTSGGIVRLARQEFDEVLADPARQIEFRSYNSSDGLAGVPVRTGYPNAARDAGGRLWFVTGNGLTLIDPGRLSNPRPPPPVRIERVSANNRSFEPAGSFELPPRSTSLQIDYTAIEFFSPRQVQFRYRLDGLDAEGEWTDAGARRQALFTNLPPRAYRFRVIARGSEGIWNEHGDTVEFSVQPTFYQTGWFSALCVVAALGTAVAGWQLRLREVRRQFAVVLTERARMAREIHDTLLQSLAGLELQVDAMSSQLHSSQGVVRQQLERVRRQIQSDVSEARQSIWDLRSPSLETRDLVGALRELGETFAGASGVRFEFAVSGHPSRCARKVEEHLLRVGREAVSNAVRHAQASLVRLELCYGDDSITLRVSDDGRGFDVAGAARQTENHWGLATMHERAQAIGGHLNLVSRPGAGTDLEMIAPLLPSHP